MSLGAKSLLSMLALALAAPGVSPAGAQPRRRAGTGTVCVAPATPPPEGVGVRSLATPAGEPRARAYKVQIDGRPAVETSGASGVKIGGLALGRRHLVKIYGDGKLLESFRFRFADYSSRELCLWFKSMYETWSLWEAKNGGAECRCR
ncbi:MAG TPA: hypothetical protein VN228_07735 [Pyrinomonadaceae bacterium]|nr:hypothetical protein [Pyrinomonadaceae bacterium]